MKHIANFFWYGELTKIEKSCINSFVKNRFIVRLWSYQNHFLPGVECADASLILPKKDINKYVYRTNHHKKPNSLAAFANIFRYKLLSKYGGWWFDTDCFCLKDVNEFKKLEGNFIVGKETNDRENNAVIYSDMNLATKLYGFALKRIKKTNFVSTFIGQTGPFCVADFCKDNNIKSLSKSYFYPIYCDDMNEIVDPLLFKDSKEKIKDSYIVHLWDSHFKLYNINKNNPPKDSLLDYLIK